MGSETRSWHIEQMKSSFRFKYVYEGAEDAGRVIFLADAAAKSENYIQSLSMRRRNKEES
jgi:hypothetical protein